MSSGRYRCEVSAEAPSFQTVSDHSDMLVVGTYAYSNNTSIPRLLFTYIRPNIMQFSSGCPLSRGWKLSVLWTFRPRNGTILYFTSVNASLVNSIPASTMYIKHNSLNISSQISFRAPKKMSKLSQKFYCAVKNEKTQVITLESFRQLDYQGFLIIL